MVKLGALTHDAGERAESRRWFERAAADGDAQAMFALAGMCLAEDDEQAAMGWLAAASDQGHSGAMVNLGAFAAPPATWSWQQTAGNAPPSWAMRSP